MLRTLFTVGLMAVVGLFVGVIVYALFTYGLTLSLPWGAWIPGGPS